MASVTVKIEGLVELNEKMRKLGAAVGTKIARSATNAGAQVVKKQAIRLAPEWDFGPHKLKVGGETVTVPPGNLKKNIVVKRIARSELTSEHIVTVRGKRKDNFAARYGRLVEYGTVKMSPEPFMRPAFEQEKGFAVQAIIGRVKKGIDKEWNK